MRIYFAQCSICKVNIANNSENQGTGVLQQTDPYNLFNSLAAFTVFQDYGFEVTGLYPFGPEFFESGIQP